MSILAKTDNDLIAYLNASANDVSLWSTGQDATFGNNGTFVTGGTFQGTFVTSSSSPINGIRSFVYTQKNGATSVNDWIASPVIPVPLRSRGKTISVTIPFMYSGANSDIKAVVYDVTNSAILSNNDLFPQQLTTTSTLNVVVSLPSTCTNIRVGIYTLIRSDAAILKFDDIQVSDNPFMYSYYNNFNSTYVEPFAYAAQNPFVSGGWVSTTEYTSGSSNGWYISGTEQFLTMYAAAGAGGSHYRSARTVRVIDQMINATSMTAQGTIQTKCLGDGTYCRTVALGIFGKDATYGSGGTLGSFIPSANTGVVAVFEGRDQGTGTVYRHVMLYNGTTLLYDSGANAYTESINNECKIDIQGQTISLKWWASSTSEPVAWNYQTTVGTVVKSGGYAVIWGSVNGNGSNYGECRFDNLTIGMNNNQYMNLITPAKTGIEFARYTGYISKNGSNQFKLRTLDSRSTNSKLFSVDNSGDHTVFTMLKRCLVTCSANATISGGLLIVTQYTSGAVQVGNSDSQTNGRTNGAVSCIAEVGDYFIMSSNNAGADDASTSFTITAADTEATFLAAIPIERMAIISDVKPNGTDGGTFTSGSWVTRDLNTVQGDTSIVSLSSNQFTLQAGTYEIDAYAPAYSVNGHRLALYRTTDATYVAYGLYSQSSAASNILASARITWVETITSPKTYELRHRCAVSKTTDGLGLGSAYGVPEVFSVIEIRKLAR